MSAWKVLFIFAFGCVCLVLAFATLVVPLALEPGTQRWLWFAGLLLSSICMGALFALYLNHADRSFKVGR